MPGWLVAEFDDNVILFAAEPVSTEVKLTVEFDAVAVTMEPVTALARALAMEEGVLPWP